MRWVAAIIAIAAVVGILALELSKEGRVGVSLIVRIVLLLVAAGLARYALSRDVRTLQQSETRAHRCPPPHEAPSS